MRDSVIIRNYMDEYPPGKKLGKQIGQALIDNDIDELIEGLESGRYKLEPSFMKQKDGKLKLLEISIVPDDFVWSR